MKKKLFMQWKCFTFVILGIGFFVACVHTPAQRLVVYSAPASEMPSQAFQMYADGKSVFCYTSKVYDTRHTEGSYYGKDVLKYATASFAYFDFEGRVKVEVDFHEDVTSAVIRPLSSGVKAAVQNGRISLWLTEPGHFTIEPNGSDKEVLHLFANPLLDNRPCPHDENVIYFGPGVHEITSIQLSDSQTVFIDGGAVVRVVVGEDETPYRSEFRPKGIELKRYDHAISGVDVKHVRVAGRGILDLDAVAQVYGRKNPLHFTRCEDVSVSGIVIRQAPCWNVTFYRCHHVRVDNIKALSCLFNSDGINMVLSHHVRVKNCFLRQRDDGIVMKAMDTGNMDCFIHEEAQPRTSTSDVLVENCTIWSDWGYALGVTYEIRMPVHDITFRNSDIIHATHRSNQQGVLGVLVADQDVCSDVLFEDIRVERSLKPLIRIDTRLTPWTVNESLGQIRGITFRDVQFLGAYDREENPIIIEGRSESSTVSDILFENVTIDGKRLQRVDDWQFQMNAFVSGIRFE